MPSGLQASGENAFVLVSNSSITGNDLGSFPTQASHIFTRTNNTLAFNAVDGFFTGTVPAQLRAPGR